MKFWDFSIFVDADFDVAAGEQSEPVDCWAGLSFSMFIFHNLANARLQLHLFF